MAHLTEPPVGTSPQEFLEQMDFLVLQKFMVETLRETTIHSFVWSLPVHQEPTMTQQS